MLDLRQSYREGLASQIDALEMALAGAGTESIDSLRRLAHRLHGSGATYGFPEISEAAREVEQAPAPEIRQPGRRLLALLQRMTAEEAPAMIDVLVVEDDAVDREIVSLALAAGHRRIHCAATMAEAVSIIERESIGLVVLDLVLPDSDGRNLLVRLRENPRSAGTPVFVLSARLSVQIKAECLALGAEQFFEKPADPELLSAAAGAALHRSLERTRDSRRDPLTGLPNRAAFREAYARAVAQLERGPRSLALTILDLDHFKSINDEHGHAIGDAVLRWSSELVSGSIRRGDVLARWGGEEFVVLLPDTDERGGLMAMQNALAALGAQPFITPGGEEVQVTFSAGVAEALAGDELDEVLVTADRCLYLAKESGRARVLGPSSEVPIATKKILLVEDDPAVAALVSSKLGRDGMEVVHCSNGRDALRAVGQHAIAMGILDVNMPGMDGYELLRQLRRTARFKDKPVMMLTGRGSESDIVMGFDNGADDYVVKPFSVAELQARVHRLLKR